MIKFELLKKMDFERNSKNIFTILSNNMSHITPMGNSAEDDYIEWKNAVGAGLHKEVRNIILIYFCNLLIGFFQYYANAAGIFMMEEIQIASEYQGKEYDVFRKLYGFMFSILPPNIMTVEAYANKKITNLRLYCCI